MKYRNSLYKIKTSYESYLAKYDLWVKCEVRHVDMEHALRFEHQLSQQTKVRGVVHETM